MMATVWLESWVRRAKSALGMAPWWRMACKTMRSLNWRMPLWLEPRMRRGLRSGAAGVSASMRGDRGAFS